MPRPSLTNCFLVENSHLVLAVEIGLAYPGPGTGTVTGTVTGTGTGTGTPYWDWDWDWDWDWGYDTAAHIELAGRLVSSGQERECQWR